MAGELLQEERKLENGWVVWSAKGRVDMRTAEDIYKRGEEIIKREEKSALDFSGTEYLSSAGIRVLLRIYELAKKLGHTFTVAGAKDMVKDVLEASGMDTLLDAKETVSDLE